METPLVLDKLVQISLHDPDDDLRYAALQHLIATGRPGLIGPYVRVLASNDNVLVNRAAEALGTIGNRDAIGPLIDAVVTKHKTKIAGGNPNQHAYTFTPSGGTSMNFGSTPPKVVVQDSREPGGAGGSLETRRHQLRLRPGRLAELAHGRSQGPPDRYPKGPVKPT